MKRYMLNLSYMGTHYRGSQKSSNKGILDIDSVQGAIEASLIKLELAKNPILVMAGRTDAGVHALCTTAHLDIEHVSGTTTFHPDGLSRLMNKHLIATRHQIRILSCQEVNQDFHARFSAKRRSYLYRIMSPKDPENHKIPIIEANHTLHLNPFPQKLNIERMKKGLELFNGRKDFTTFSARTINKNKQYEHKKSYIRTMNATMEEATPLMAFDPLSEYYNFWNITFRSQSFLYNQIRRIVGALIALGLNKISEKEIITMLQVPSHNNWSSKITPAAPHGLYLMSVEYDKADTQQICR